MPNESTLAERIADFAVSFPYDKLPNEVIQSVKSRVLDILGICVAATALPTSEMALAYALGQGGAEQAHAIGAAGALPANLAAFVNGVLAHSLDYDDTHLPSVLHPSATVIPAALAAAEMNGANGTETIAAIACGLEVCVRLGMAGYNEKDRNSTFFDNGQHATSICGALGAAVSVALIQGFDATGIVDSLGVVASMASGIIEANRTGGTVKRMHCGWAANSALAACQLVKYGFTGPPSVLEGRFGFFQAWLHGVYNPAAITDGLGIRWEVPGIFFKPYPANHFTHTAIDAAIAIRKRGVDLDKIASISLGVAAPILNTIGEPIEVKRTPETGYMAQFSGPYAVTAGLLGGGGLGVGLDDYTDALARDPRRRELMAKVEVVASERCGEIFPNQFPSVLTVTLTDGSQMVEEVLFNRGGSQRPLSYQELETKFRDNARRVLPPEKVANLQEVLGNLENLTQIASIFDHLGTETVKSGGVKTGNI